MQTLLISYFILVRRSNVTVYIRVTKFLRTYMMECNLRRGGLGKIEVVGLFGRDLKGSYCDRPEQVVQYLNLPQGLENSQFVEVDWDLNIRNPKDERQWNGTTFEHVFEWIMRNSRDENGKPIMPKVDFVCKRRHLQYLLEPVFKTDKKLLAKRVQDEPNGAPDPKRPIREYDDMALVYCANVGLHRVLYAGEVDGLPSDTELNNLNATSIVELKTVKFIEQKRLPNWWIQSALSKSDRLLVGLRDTDGHVRRLQWFPLDLIEQQAEGSNWSPKDLVSKARSALDVIAMEMANADGDSVVMFEITRSGLKISKKTPPQYALKTFQNLAPYEEWARKSAVK
ncbi:hypothetical protein B566_EDAN001130 [Ephemera danica]|nr:hypothetical protein B566_EDAN001130 [Ephemera danica]